MNLLFQSFFSPNGDPMEIEDLQTELETLKLELTQTIEEQITLKVKEAVKKEIISKVIDRMDENTD